MGQRITRAKAQDQGRADPLPRAVRAGPARPGSPACSPCCTSSSTRATSRPAPTTTPCVRDLTAEAIRLTRLVRALLPADGEVAGLLALMLLTEARRPARVSADGELVALGEQDRGAWDGALIAEGHRPGARAPRRRRSLPGATRSSPRSTPCTPTPATSATPTGRRSSRSTTSWSASTPRRSSPSTGPSRSPSSTARRSRWPTIDGLGDALDGYHAFHATRAELLRRLGRSEESRAAYDRAIALAGNTAEIAYLSRRRDELG